MADNRTRIWFALFVLAVFAVGLASGVMLGRRMGPPGRPFDPLRPGMGAARPGGPPPGRLIERLQRDLSLTPEQRTEIEAIFESRRQALEAVQKDVITRAGQQQRELQAEIRRVLTPEQQERFDRWLEATPRGRGRGPGSGRGGPLGRPR